MRLTSSVAIALAASLLAAPQAAAQMSFSIAAGAALPMGNSADGLEMGYNATVGLGIKPPLFPVGARVEGMFNAFGFKDAAFKDFGLRVMALTANATLGAPVLPLPMTYLIGGLGMYNSQITGATPAPNASNDFGFNIGVGFNIPLTGFGTFIEARYHHVPGDGGAMKFVPITVGIKF